MEPAMNIRDRLYMPPLEKYEVYGRFPWKIALHLLLVALVTCEIIVVVNRGAMYSLDQYRLWNLLFQDNDTNGAAPSIINSYNLFSRSELYEYVQQMVSRYYDVNDFTLEEYGYFWVNGMKKPPLLEVEYVDSTKDQQFLLTRTDLGPLGKKSLDSFLSEVRKFTLTFHLMHHLPESMHFFSTCYEWVITQTYDFSSRGPINVTMDSNSKRCKESQKDPFTGYQWLSIAVAALALLCFCTTWSHIMRRAVIVSKLKNKASALSAWEALDVTTKLKFFNFWVVVALLGNLCQLFGSLSTILDDMFIATTETLLGFGCFFAWVTAVGDLQHNSVAYTIMSTLKRALPVVIPFVVGMMPIFMAYAFLGTALFWPTGYFRNPMMSMMAQFALVNGDSVYMLSSAMAGVYFFIGQVYFFTFLVFFIW